MAQAYTVADWASCGVVKRVRNYGVFVDIGDLYALLPTANIIHSSAEYLSQILKVDAPIEAMIVELDIERGRVILKDGKVRLAYVNLTPL